MSVHNSSILAVVRGHVSVKLPCVSHEKNFTASKSTKLVKRNEMYFKESQVHIAKLQLS